MSLTRKNFFSGKYTSEKTETLSRNDHSRLSCTLPLSVILPQLTKPVFYGQNKTEGFLTADWEVIIGEYASLGKPIRLRNKVLTICCDTLSAVTLYYERIKLIDRINHWFGKEVVIKLKIVHDSSQKRSIKPKAFTSSPAPYSASVIGVDNPAVNLLPSDLSLEECLTKLQKTLNS